MSIELSLNDHCLDSFIPTVLNYRVSVGLGIYIVYITHYPEKSQKMYVNRTKHEDHIK